MTTRRWSTSSVPKREQFAFWREAVCEAVLNVATEHPGEGFAGEIACSNYDGLRFAAFASTPHEIVRSKSHIARSRDEHFLVSLQRGGVSRMFQHGDVCELLPGDIGVVDGTRPFRVEFPQAVDRVVAVIPYAQLRSRAPWIERRSLSRIAGDSALRAVLRFYLERLAGPDCASSTEAAALSENVCNLIALATATSDAERNSARPCFPQPSLDHVLFALRHRLADPCLSPRVLAERLRMSVRTLHKRFKDAETTFGECVLDNRLRACQRAFDDPRQDAFTISEIAFGWGFNDLSHFSKTFKARYGMSPSEYRREARGKSGGEGG